MISLWGSRHRKYLYLCKTIIIPPRYQKYLTSYTALLRSNPDISQPDPRSALIKTTDRLTRDWENTQ